jgi:MFS family permease
LTAASAELVGQTFVLLTIETWGRVRTQALSYLLGGISVFGLAWFAAGNSKRGILMFLAFLARMFMMGSSSTTWVVTAELLPTQIRNTGHASANAMARLGGAFSPFIVASSTPMRLIGIIMGAVAAVTCVLSWQLPETQGKALGTAHVSRQNTMTDDNVSAPTVEIGQASVDKTKEII